MQKRGDKFVKSLPWKKMDTNEQTLFENAIEAVVYQRALEEDTFGGWD